MSRRITTGERLRYAFDKSMAAGPISLIGWLALMTLVVIFVATLFLELTEITNEGSPPLTFAEGFWQALMRTMDPGSMAGDAGWYYRFVTLGITVSGIFIFSALIGILSNAMNDRLMELRKGRSRVLERDHTIILNWSPSIFDIISELVVANASRHRPRIVIMATKDKVEMEDEIAAKIPNLRNTRIICRSGDPTDLYDLSLVSPEVSRSVIVLSPEDTDPDSQVIKTILALVNDPKRRSDRYQIAAELRDARNAEVARIVGAGEVQLVLADELIARIVVHSSRQTGLSSVYSELLDFEGCEIYTAPQPDLTGKTFREALLAYESCAPLGICDASGKVTLNPAMDTVITEGARLIVVAEDDTALKATGALRTPDTAAIRLPARTERGPERSLILGWNRRGPMIAAELARYLAPGSTLTIAADTPELDRDVEGLAVDRTALTLDFRRSDTGHRATLEALDIPSYDHVMVLGYSDHMSAQAADTRTLVTLLHIRKIADQAGEHISVVSEMIDVRNRELAEVTRADDFVVSNKLVSLMLAQASENAYLAAIFDDLLDEKGAEIYMRPIEAYVATDTPVDFYTVVEAARRRGEVAFGYCRPRPDQADARKLGGVVVNPAKSEVLAYRPGDRVIVLANS